MDVPDQDETPTLNPAKQGEVESDMQVRPRTYKEITLLPVQPLKFRNG